MRLTIINNNYVPNKISVAKRKLHQNGMVNVTKICDEI